jgi:hypothetical protein
MANILLRSPYFIYDPRATALSAKLELSIENVLVYTIIKNTDNANGALFEIAELSKDYLIDSFNGTYTSNTVSLSIIVRYYDGLEGSGTQVGADAPYFHEGFNGYSNFEEGKNAVTLPNSLLISNRIIYQPESTAGVIPREVDGQIVYSAFSTATTSITLAGQVFTIVRLCEPKFTPIKVTFVNKFGALQDLWFFKKFTKNLTVSKDRYKRHTISQSGGYSINSHQDNILRANGNERITLNTSFVDETMNEPIKQLLLSESVWATINEVVLPIIVTTENLQYKTKVNEKLIQYTIECEFAFQAINNIR